MPSKSEAASRLAITAQANTPASWRFRRGFDVHKLFRFSSDNRMELPLSYVYHTPLGYMQEKMSHLENKQKLMSGYVARRRH
jgi:hypothetical protein